MTNLTKKELQVLALIAGSNKEETLEMSQDSSEMIARDFAEILKMNEQQIGGIVSSLEQKGIAKINSSNGDLNWIESGVEIYYQNLAA